MTINSKTNNQTPPPVQPLPSVQLALNGKPIYLRDFKATFKVVRNEKDMSGQKSSTKKSEKGIKAKELYITGLIPFRNPEWLSDLVALYEAGDKKGSQVKYRIANRLAQASNMREGVFSDELSVTQQSQQAWAVSFKLAEINSVAEKKAKRTKKPTAKVQSEKVSSQEQAKASESSTESKKQDNSIWAKINSAIGE